MKKIIIPILVLLLLTGYTPYVEVNDLVIVDMLGLEKVDNYYILTINTVYEEKDNNATKSIYKDYVFKGKSLGKVFLEAKKINTKKAYYGHLKLVVFQSKLLDKELINYFQKEFPSIEKVKQDCIISIPTWSRGVTTKTINHIEITADVESKFVMNGLVKMVFRISTNGL